MSVNFPNSPSIGQTFTTGGSTFQWNGTVWENIIPLGNTGYTGSIGYTGSQGDIGYSGSSGSWQGISTNTTLTVNRKYLVDSSGGAITLTLPASPSVGDYVYLGDANDWETNNITVLPNGNLIEGSASDLLIDIGGILVALLYSGVTGGWQVSATIGKQGDVGYTGSIGYAGSQGDFGYTGSIGYSGSNGTDGYTGSIGYAGSAAVGGGGDFNTNVSAAVGYALTASLATAYTAPSTAGQQYIVRSAHITNISEADTTVTGNFSGTNYSNITFATSVPVPVGTSVELFKRPKVMNPDDLLQLQAGASSALYAYIVYETQTSTSYFGAGVDVTADATYTDLYTATGNGVIESVLVSNDDATYDVKVRVVYTDGSDNIVTYLAYDMIIPAQSTVELLEAPKYIANGYKIRVYANVGNRVEAIIAGKLA